MLEYANLYSVFSKINAENNTQYIVIILQNKTIKSCFSYLKNNIQLTSPLHVDIMRVFTTHFTQA